MLDHVSLGVRDLERSPRFYDAILRPLGLVRTVDRRSWLEAQRSPGASWPLAATYSR